MGGWGWFFLIFFLILLAYGAWCGWQFWSARRQGLPPPPMRAYIPFMKTNVNTNYPTPRSSGPLEWIKDRIAGLRNKRTAQGAYEETGGAVDQGNSRGRRGRGLEENDAWDTRVEQDETTAYGHGPGGAYYSEEQELGIAPTPGYTANNEPYGRGGDYLSADTGYNGAESNGGGSGSTRRDHDNPFGDENRVPSLRSVSPRPEIDTSSKMHKKDKDSVDSAGSSPASVRKSVFREGI